MIIADTSIWVDHFRREDEELKGLLYSGQVLLHPFIIGELSLGHFRSRKTVLQMLNDLPKAIIASDDEVAVFIEKHRLYGLGIGYIDSHLLASAFLTKVRIWTKDKRFKEVAVKLGCAYSGH